MATAVRSLSLMSGMTAWALPFCLLIRTCTGAGL